RISPLEGETRIVTDEMVHRALVDTDVFAAIWRARKPGEETENEVLRRIYGLAPVGSQTAPIATAIPPSSHGARLNSEPAAAGKSSTSHKDAKFVIHHE